MVTGRHVEVTDAMKAYAVEKISKLERIAPRIIDVAVTMDIQRFQHKVAIVMKYGHTLIKSSAATTDMYASVDIAVDKLAAQLRRYLSKLHEHHAKEYPVKEVAEVIYEAAYDADIGEINDEIEAETRKQREKELKLPQIIRTEKQPVKILSNEEAIMKMDLSKAPCLVFRGENDRKLKVIYRRHDGNYGVIEAE